MYHVTGRLTLFMVLVSTTPAIAQSLPTSQPNVLQIFREEVKVGHDADHAKTEAAVVAAFERAKFPHFVIGLASLTGPPEAWFVIPFDSHAAIGESIKHISEEPLGSEFARLSRADAEHVTSLRSIQAVARKDLSRGPFPDAGKQRFYEITIFRVRPGHEGEFAAAGKAYGAAAGRSAPSAAYRVYEVTAGMPTPTYLIFSSMVSFGDVDKMMSDGEATMKAATSEEMAALQKFSTDALISSETFRFRLDPEMSYVPKEVRAQDPSFWMPKKPAPVKKPTSQQ
jgi:hypothetical protein